MALLYQNSLKRLTLVSFYTDLSFLATLGLGFNISSVAQYYTTNMAPETFVYPEPPYPLSLTSSPGLTAVGEDHHVLDLFQKKRGLSQAQTFTLSGMDDLEQTVKEIFYKTADPIDGFGYMTLVPEDTEDSTRPKYSQSVLTAEFLGVLRTVTELYTVVREQRKVRASIAVSLDSPPKDNEACLGAELHVSSLALGFKQQYAKLAARTTLDVEDGVLLFGKAEDSLLSDGRHSAITEGLDVTPGDTSCMYPFFKSKEPVKVKDKDLKYSILYELPGDSDVSDPSFHRINCVGYKAKFNLVLLHEETERAVPMAEESPPKRSRSKEMQLYLNRQHDIRLSQDLLRMNALFKAQYSLDGATLDSIIDNDKAITSNANSST